jgi:hypothetical protein
MIGANRGGIEPSDYVLNPHGATDLEKRIARRVRRRKKCEATVEERAVEIAKSRGWLARKMNGLGYAAWPDRLFIPPEAVRAPDKGWRFWVEFKRHGQKPTPAQLDMIRTLRSRGEKVYVCDTFEKFEKAFGEQTDHHDNRP